MSNPLRIASIKKDTATESRLLWENVLKPKWKARNKEKAERELKKLKITIIILFFLSSCAAPRICKDGHTHYRAYKYSLTH